MKATYNNEPQKLQAVGNGSFFYRWNIRSLDDEFVCNEIVVFAPLTANKIVREVIVEMWDNSHENKLVNEYNAAMFGMYTSEVAEQKINEYRSFLIEREALKIQIESDCEELGIK